MIHVPVGHVELVRGGIDDHVGGGTQVLCVVAAAPVALPADLHQELSLPRELQDVRVLVAPGAKPDMVLRVDVDAVLELRPFVALTGPAPRRE